MSKRKVPKRGPARYKHAYNAGYRAGQVKAAKEKVGEFRKAYPKIETAAQELMKEHEATSILPTDTRAIKWQGFTEAMNLIIASKRG